MTLDSLAKVKSGQETYERELVKVSRDAGIGGGGIILGSLLTYLTTIFATRVVGAEKFGIFFLAHSILLIAVLVSTLGLNQGVLRYVSLYQGKNDGARIKGTVLLGLKWTFVLSIFMALVLFLFAPILANDFFHEPDLKIALQILIIALPFATVTEILLSSLQGLRLITQNTVVKNIVRPTARLTLLAILFALGLKLLGLLYATAISFLVGCVLAYYYLKEKSTIFNSRSLPIYEKSSMVRFSTPLYFEALLNYLIMFMPVLILGYFRTSLEVGVLGIVIRLGLIVSLPLTSINLIFAPTISNLYGRGEKEALGRLFKTLTKWIFTISLAFSFVMILLAKPILSIFGSSFVLGATALYFVVLGELVNAGVGSVGYVLMMTGRPKINLMNSIILSMMTLVAGVVLIPPYGILGAAVASSLSVLIINLLRLFEVYYFEQIHPYDMNFAKPLMAGVSSFFAVLAFRKLMPSTDPLSPVLSFLIFGMIFVSVLFLLKLNDDDKHILRLIVRKLGVG